MALKAEGILTHAEIVEMTWEDLVSEWREFCAYTEAQNRAIEARSKKTR